MDTKERILLIAYKMFINHGFHNTSMQQLVEASHLSKGAFYHHFKSKKDLYKQVIDHYFLSFYKEIDWAMYQSKSLSIQEIEYEIKRFYLNFLPKILPITNDGLSRYFIMYFEAFNLLSDFKSEVQNFYKNLENLIIHAQDNPDHSIELARNVIAKYEGILFLMAINPELKLSEVFS